MSDASRSAETAPFAVRLTAGLLLVLAGSVAFDLLGVLRGLGERPTLESSSIRLDPRTATAAELELVPGIGHATASRIVEHRRRHGRESLLVEDGDGGRRWALDLVPGVGPVTARRAAAYLKHPSLRDDRASIDAHDSGGRP